MIGLSHRTQFSFPSFFFSHNNKLPPLPKLYPILYSILFNKQEPLNKVMEELPRNLLLNIPLKAPDKLQWSCSLLDYITKSYAEDAKKYNNDCIILDAMRNHCLYQSTSAPFALEDMSM